MGCFGNWNKWFNSHRYWNILDFNLKMENSGSPMTFTLSPKNEENLGNNDTQITIKK